MKIEILLAELEICRPGQMAVDRFIPEKVEEKSLAIIKSVYETDLNLKYFLELYFFGEFKKWLRDLSIHKDGILVPTVMSEAALMLIDLAPGGKRSSYWSLLRETELTLNLREAGGNDLWQAMKEGKTLYRAYTDINVMMPNGLSQFQVCEYYKVVG